MPRRTKFTDFEPMQKELAALRQRVKELERALEQIAGASKGNLRNPAKIARAALAAERGGVVLHPETGIRLGEEVDALREENARLRAGQAAALVHGPEDMIRALEEKELARGEWQEKCLTAEAEVSRLSDKCAADAASAAAEILRLEGLILDGAEARHALYPVLDEAARIRAQREEGR